MTFNSVSFFAFFPLAVLVCWLVPRRWQNAALLAAQIIAVEDTDFAGRLMADREATKAKILAKDAQISAEFAQE